MENFTERTAPAGLYDSRFEHDNCGIGAVVDIKGRKSHRTLDDALQIVEHLEHRAGKDAEGKTGDGVGILLQVSHKFFVKAAAAAFTKNLWLTCNRMPTPSPVFPSASLPARCSRCSTICSASSSVRWLLRPLISTTAPMPQLSCSNRESYNPAGAVRSVKFSIAFSPLGYKK